MAQKTLHALRTGLKVVLCIGETLEDRKAGRTMELLFSQPWKVEKLAMLGAKFDQLELRHRVLCRSPQHTDPYTRG